jgi:peptidoglycan hydrolase-like amidase
MSQKLKALSLNPSPQKTTQGAKAAKPEQSDSAQQSARPAAAQTSTAQSRPAPGKRAAAPRPPAASGKLTIDAALEMRVALVKDAASVVVATSNGGRVVSLEGQVLQTLGSGQGYQADISSGGLRLQGRSVPGAVWVQPDNGYVAVGDRWYRGQVLLLLRENGILAVNYVLLQDYLYSVVGAEMSASWPIEALKAQAVAARSYAMVHSVRWANRDYDLDNTPRYQAYGGLAKEANTTQAAVHATAGEFISHQGGIVESLYAATQDIVNDAHRGFGMSQTGALDLARQGYPYHEILGYYYPQTAIGRLDVSE